MTALSTATNERTRRNGQPTEKALSSADYRFVFFSNPERQFTNRDRPYRLIYGKPSLQTYTNAIYTPAVREANFKLGCLYDEQGRRIEASATRRNRDDRLFNKDPLNYEGDTANLPVYDRPVLYLGYLFPHFSHFMIEGIAHWWALTEELGDVDGYVVHLNDPANLERSYIKTTMAALGIRDKVLYFDKPTRLSKVIVPGNSAQLHSHIYTSYKDIFNKLALALGAAEAAPPRGAVYLSRSKDKRGVRRYHGEEEIEAFLAERGVTIAHLGQLPLREQVRIINEHERIIGFQGGQMLNIAFALEPKEVVYLSDHHVWGSALLTDICFGHKSTYVKVAGDENAVRESLRYLIRRATGRQLKSEGFSRGHVVDLEKTKAWLSQELAGAHQAP